MYPLFFASAGAVLMMLVLMPLYLYLKWRKSPAGLALTIKGLTTFVAFSFCLAGCLAGMGLLPGFAVSAGYSTSYLLAAGLFLCMAADVILGVHFLTGMGVFLLGHLCYLAYFYTLAGFNWPSILVFAVFLVPLYLYLSPHFKKLKKGSLPYYIYGVTILSTLSIALLLPFTLGEQGLFPAFGTVLFVLSDILLVRNILIRSTNFSDAVSLAFYYSGQFLLAMSLFLPAFLPL